MNIRQSGRRNILNKGIAKKGCLRISPQLANVRRMNKIFLLSIYQEFLKVKEVNMSNFSELKTKQLKDMLKYHNKVVDSAKSSQEAKKSSNHLLGYVKKELQNRNFKN